MDCPTEMIKLMKMLQKAHIPYETVKYNFRTKNSPDYILYYPDNNRTPLYQVSFTDHSKGHENGLLESWTHKSKEEPIGFRTAEEIFDDLVIIDEVRIRVEAELCKKINAK